RHHRSHLSFPTRRPSDLELTFRSFRIEVSGPMLERASWFFTKGFTIEITSSSTRCSFTWDLLRVASAVETAENHAAVHVPEPERSEEHTSELQSREKLVC